MEINSDLFDLKKKLIMEIQDLDSQMKSNKEKVSELRSKSQSILENSNSAHKRGGSFEIATTSSFGKLKEDSIKKSPKKQSYKFPKLNTPRFGQKELFEEFKPPYVSPYGSFIDSEKKVDIPDDVTMS